MLMEISRLLVNRLTFIDPFQLFYHFFIIYCHFDTIRQEVPSISSIMKIEKRRKRMEKRINQILENHKVLTLYSHDSRAFDCFHHGNVLLEGDILFSKYNPKELKNFIISSREFMIDLGIVLHIPNGIRLKFYPRNYEKITEIYDLFRRFIARYQDVLDFTAVVNLGFFTKEITNYNKIHQRLMATYIKESHLFNEDMFSKFYFDWEYLTYLKHQMTFCSDAFVFNYLKEDYLYIKHIKPNLNLVEFDVLLKECFQSIFYEKFTIKEQLSFKHSELKEVLLLKSFLEQFFVMGISNRESKIMKEAMIEQGKVLLDFHKGRISVTKINDQALPRVEEGQFLFSLQ